MGHSRRQIHEREQWTTHDPHRVGHVEGFHSDAGEEVLVVAKAKLPVHSRDGVVTYHFKSEYTNPGRVREDGSIDFRERPPLQAPQAQ